MTQSFHVGDFGAAGDGVTLDTDAIIAAIAAAHAAGGGEVVFPAGRFLSFSIRLMSRITLYLSAGSVIEAADPKRHGGAYDAAEPNPFDLYQDFGHSHWRNSLIWGDGLEDIAITGPGTIDGRGLTREGPGSQWGKQAGEFPLSMQGMDAATLAELSPEVSAMTGLGNKAIALRDCRRVALRDFTIRDGGHFAVLATGVDHLTIENLLIDSNRDGLDIDGCRHVTVRACRINTPNDDAIVLKSSYALGELRPCEHIDIRDCHVSGFDLGTVLDGTLGRTQERAPDRDRVTGRIKIGTESNGDFRHITISDCVLERSRGLALETVDGGTIEDVVIRNVTMRDVTTAPLFLRLGARLRGPEGTTPGAIRRVHIENVSGDGILADYSALIVGMAGHRIEDVTLKGIRFVYDGGGEMLPAMPPELDNAYPEPSMFGPTPAYGLWARHVRNLRMNDIELTTATPDARPKLVVHDVAAG